PAPFRVVFLADDRHSFPHACGTAPAPPALPGCAEQSGLFPSDQFWMLSYHIWHIMSISETEEKSILFNFFQIFSQKIRKSFHFFPGSYRNPQEVVRSSSREVPYIYVFLAKSPEKLSRRTCFMGGKDKIRFGILKRKSQRFQFSLCPFPCLNNSITGIFKIFPVLHSRRACRQGRPVHGIGIKGIFGVVEITDQLRTSAGKTDPHPGHGTGFAESLHNQKVVVF